MYLETFAKFKNEYDDFIKKRCRKNEYTNIINTNLLNRNEYPTNNLHIL